MITENKEALSTKIIHCKTVLHLFFFQRDDDELSDSTLTDSILDEDGDKLMPSARVGYQGFCLIIK